MPSQSTLLKTASAMAPLLAPLPAMADEAGRVEVGFRARHQPRQRRARE